MSTETKKQDEIDKLLIAEGVLTEDDVEQVDELLEEAPDVDELEPDEVIPADENENAPYDPTDEFDD